MEEKNSKGEGSLDRGRSVPPPDGALRDRERNLSQDRFIPNDDRRLRSWSQIVDQDR